MVIKIHKHKTLSFEWSVKTKQMLNFIFQLFENYIFQEKQPRILLYI